MQKEIQGFRGALPLVTLFAILATTFIGSLPSSLADPPPVATGTSSTSCAGHNNSNMPNSNCNGNTPDPASGSCQLAWMNSGGGSVTLGTSQVTLVGLQQTLAGYNLRCATDVKVSSCQLVPGANDSGNTKLDLANVQNRSPWIYQQLNGQYGLNCNNNRTITSTATPTGLIAAGPNQGSFGQCFYLVSKLAPLYVDIQNSQADIGTSGTPIIAQTKNNPPTNNQLWQFVPEGNNGGYGYIQSALPGVNTGNRPLVLDIQYARSTDRTPVVAAAKNNPPTNNQFWQFVPDGTDDGYGYIISKLPRERGGSLVLDIPDANSAARTKLIVSHENNPTGQPPSPNQAWKTEDCQVQGTVNGNKMTEKTTERGRNHH